MFLKSRYVLALRPSSLCIDRFNPSYAEANTCHVGIHWIALAEYSLMSTHVSGFQSFFRLLHHFVLATLATRGIRVNSEDWSHTDNILLTNLGRSFTSNRIIIDMY